MAPAKQSRPAPTRPRPAPARRRPPVVAWVVGAFVVVAAVIAVVATRGDDNNNNEVTTPGVVQTRPVEVTGEALLVFEDGKDAAVGTVAPDLDGMSFDGTPIEIHADGQPKLVIFLAHWCQHCQREVAVIAEWLADNGNPAGVELYAVATSTSSDRPNYPPSDWLEREEFNVPSLADNADGSAATAFGLPSFPYFVALDGGNRVVARAAGELTVERWEALLDSARSSAAHQGS